MRRLTVLFTLAILLMIVAVTATAQEDDIAQYASLDQLGNVIDAFVA